MDDILKIGILVFIVVASYIINIFTTPHSVEKIKNSIKILIKISPLDSLFLKIGGVINGTQEQQLDFGKNIMLFGLFTMIAFIYLNVNDYLKLFPPRFYDLMKFISLGISFISVVAFLRSTEESQRCETTPPNTQRPPGLGAS